ncbi:ead/Ea22-like family protein [Salmonella enterica]|nr:ead/Ea22-like family protein [Salmonella enterica]EHG9855355.1 ead/Ea22-like family protein [Salmonella enterica]
MSNIDKQALREEFRLMQAHYSDPADRARQVIYIAAEALLDELDKKQQYIKLRDQENEDIALTVGKLRVELEHYKSREERVTKLVLDNSTSWDALYKNLEAAERRIAELEKGHQEAAKQINSWRRLAKQNIAERGKDISELEAARQRIAEQSAIVAAAEKLVRCKGRYHSELNYRALAKLFGVVTPDLPPLEHENVHYADAAEVEITALRQRIQELEAKLETADKLQDSAFRDGLKAGFSYGQTDDQSGFAQCMSAYSTRAGIKVKGE